MLGGIPLLIVPFILFNLGLAGIVRTGAGSDLWASGIFSAEDDVRRRVLAHGRRFAGRSRRCCFCSWRS